MSANGCHAIVEPGPDWPHWPAIGRLFTQQYAYYATCGYAFGLRNGGVELWLRRIANRNARARFFAAAIDPTIDAPIGFVEASWCLAPPYAAIRTMGRIDHIWLDPSRRGGAVASDMLARAEAWLAQHTTVLWHEALDNNLAGTGFWDKTGYARKYALFEKILGTSQAASEEHER